MTTKTSWMRMAGVAAALLMTAAGEARAQWTVTPYVWATGLDVGVKLNGSTVLDQHIGFTELIEDVDLAAMVRVERQFGAWGAMLDLFHVGMSTTGTEAQVPDGPTGTLDTDIGLTILDATASYSLSGGVRGLALVAGTRLLIERAEATFSVPASPAPLTRTEETSDVLANAIVGLRFRRQLTSRLSMDARGDVGTGGTELTWSAGSEMVWAFGGSRQYAIRAGYRRLTVRYREDASVQADMTMAGFITGFQIAF